MPAAAFDPYAILGLSPGANSRQVRDAYRRLARRYHPDRTDDPRATERMQAINRAWAILSDPSRRARVDAGTQPRATTTAHWSGARPAGARWAPPPAAWSTGTTSVPRYRSPVNGLDDARPSWARLVAGVLLLLIAPVLFIALPLPFFGLFLLLGFGLLGRGEEH